jgi:hypothetical protein
MSVFTTVRSNPNDKLDELKKLHATRKDKYNKILENTQADKEAKATKDILDAADKKQEQLDKNKEVVNDVIDRRTNARKNEITSTMESNLTKKGFEILFNQAIFEMAHRALWIDDEVKNKPENIRSMYETFLDVKSNLDKTIGVATTETTLISNLKSDIMEVVKEASARIVAEAKGCKSSSSCEDLDSIDFNLSAEEDEKLSNMVNLTSDQISELVRDKVLAVVKDEKQNGKAKAEMFDKINDELKAAETTPVEGDESEAEPTVKESFDASRTRAIRTRFNRGSRSSLFESIMMYNTKFVNEATVKENVSVSEDINAAVTLTNTILHYTILETFNTLKLYDMSNPINASKLIDMYK